MVKGAEELLDGKCPPPFLDICNSREPIASPSFEFTFPSELGIEVLKKVKFC